MRSRFVASATRCCCFAAARSRRRAERSRSAWPCSAPRRSCRHTLRGRCACCSTGAFTSARRSSTGAAWAPASPASCSSHRFPTRRSDMGEIIDKLKGKAKQVEGILTDDKARQREGEADETKGQIEGVINRVEETVDRALV